MNFDQWYEAHKECLSQMSRKENLRAAWEEGYLQGTMGDKNVSFPFCSKCNT